jgi:inositol-polyphosphate multikinase
VWDPDKEDHIAFPKTYGRTLTTETLPDGFSTYFSSLKNPTHRRLIIQRMIADVEAIQAMLLRHESRMYSSSLLFVYEGDAEALEDGIQEEAREEVIEEDMEDEDEENERIPQFISKIKLIDFAHARFCPGEGPDMNVLPGVEKVLEHLKMMNT